MSRGGRRQGSPGVNYSNRSDLRANYAPTAPPALAPAAAPQSGPVQSAQPTQTAAAPVSGPPLAPGSLALLPTQRPGEPITHGLPSGPGGGPEVLQRPFQPDPVVQASALLSALPAVHQTPALQALARATAASVANGTQTSIAQGV